MKIKRTAIIVALLAAVMALLVLIPTMILPTLAADVTYANNTFESMTLGTLSKSANYGTTAPSLAKVVNVDGNRVIRLDTVPANPSNPEGVASGTDANVDKNIRVATKAISYTESRKIYLQAEYFVSADAKGSVQSQFFHYTCAEKTGTQAWMGLYFLNLTTGAVRTDYKSTGANVLVKDAWNTVTTVYDLESGVIDLYVNHVHVIHDDTCKYTQIALPENEWIVAKLNKASTVDNFGGYILIDDAKIATSQDSYEATLPLEDENGGKLMYVEVTNSAGHRSVSSVASAKYFDAAGGALNPVYLHAEDYKGLLAPVKGGSIRLTNAAGIRFGTQIDLDMLQSLLKLKADGMVADVSIGTLITPRSYVEAAGAFTKDALESNLSVSGSK